ncbi:MAG: putative transposase YbfD/YdcC [Candidatus Paceibacteria bacterium]|jgi:predicted transposase YbfD/YdcC
MLFIYLLIASMIGISIVIIIEYKKTENSLLQILKKLCSIDSVHFEQKLKKTKNHSKALRKHVTHLGKSYFLKFASKLESQGNKFRSLVRKKFHPETKTQEGSIFIQTMNEED